MDPFISPSFQFCIPPNPLLKALRIHAETNLSKLRSCRNIAGIKRELDAYVAATDTITGAPTLNAGGQLALPGINALRPTLYRYNTLIERAKLLTQLANQLEISLLNALEKRDNESFTMLKVRQELSVAQAGVQFQNVRITEALSEVKLAELQRDRTQIQIDKYNEWITAGLIKEEEEMLNNLFDSIQAQYDVIRNESVLRAMQFSVDPFQSLSSMLNNPVIRAWADAGNRAASATANIQLYSFYASHERRKQEWEFQLTLAQQDFTISNQQIQIANNRVDIVKQEKAVAELQASNARDTISFLTTKFTNVDLYEWMSTVFEGIYRFFLQQATSMARLAENQLAFERQESLPSYIKNDYWQVTEAETQAGATNGKATDRKGLTGSTRLLQDIYQLDQYAFTTNKRKLQLTKTFSLSSLAPAEFQRFRETGTITFATAMEHFDREFPGHYLRLIRRVRTSVIALIPPIQGIRATLTTTGLSRVVIGSDVFQTIPIRRDPEFVSLCSPLNASGLLELEPQQNDMLFPFEGNGVDTTWEFRMPKAANLFDYRTIADVLITIEYTALNSFDYAQQVMQTLNPKISADRPFSFRNQFADQWFDLHNPDQTKTPMSVSFQTIREDFPPNIDGLAIQHVLVYFVCEPDVQQQLPLTELKFTEKENIGAVGGTATPVDGIISTRRGNAGSWTSMIGKSPAGNWQFTLPDTEQVRKLFSEEKIQDMLFVITYAGRTPAWPA